MYKNILLLCCLVFITSAEVFGQSSEQQETPSEDYTIPRWKEFQSDRPSIVDAPVLMPPGALNIEAGFQVDNDNPEGRVEQNLLANFGALLRYGVLPTLELRLSGQFANKVTVVSGLGTNAINGVGNVSIGAKMFLAEEYGFMPAMAFVANLAIPAGDTAFSPQYVVPALSLLASNSLSEQWSLTYNVGIAYNSLDIRAITSYAVCLDYAFSSDIGCFGEVYGDKEAEQEATFLADAGVWYMLSENLQLDLWGGAAFSESATDAFVSAGFSLRL